MPTFRYTIDGRAIPSVTSVIGILGENKRALLHAAWKLGMEGKNYRDVWGKEANAGTLAHALSEAHMLGRPLPRLDDQPDDVVKGAVERFENFRTWLRQHSYKAVCTEVSIVNRTHEFGGTIDCVGYIEDRPAIIDLKSKTLYKDQIIQVAAYRLLWEQEHPDLEIGSVHILGMSDGFHHHQLSAENLCRAEEAFLALLRLYKCVKEIKT